jgi:HTH-type transcriptional regulator/antitoxin HigA
VAEIDRLLDLGPQRGTGPYERLESFSVLVAAYEDAHDPLDERGTPQSVIDFMLEHRSMTRIDLAVLIGGRVRVSEFFSGKRRLSIRQIQRLREEMGIPADLLMG